MVRRHQQIEQKQKQKQKRKQTERNGTEHKLMVRRHQPIDQKQNRTKRSLERTFASQLFLFSLLPFLPLFVTVFSQLSSRLVSSRLVSSRLVSSLVSSRSLLFNSLNSQLSNARATPHIQSPRCSRSVRRARRAPRRPRCSPSSLTAGRRPRAAAAQGAGCRLRCASRA